MAEQTQPNPNSASAKAQILNDRTYQEVEYLKKNLGPILVAALAEICIRRPADPIEYLGHWLLRWRYNEELKRRDVQNALEVVRQKAWSKDDENAQPNPAAPDQPAPPDQFTQGFVPGAAFAPPGFGGPLDQNVVEEALRPEGEAPPQTGEGEEEEGADEVLPPAEGEPGADAVAPSGSSEQQQQQLSNNELGEGQTAEAKTSPTAQEGRRLSQEEKQPGSGAAIDGTPAQRTSTDAQAKRASGEVTQVTSGEQQPAPTAEEKRRSSKKSVDGIEKRTSGQQDTNNAEAVPEEPPAAE